VGFGIEKKEIWKVFDKISPYYDLINRILSFGLDRIWRKNMGLFLPKKSKLCILDIATGTADVILSLRSFSLAIGIDRSEGMLHRARKKTRFYKNIFFVKADALFLPFLEESFDAVTVAFGIRNVQEPVILLKEAHRVLKKDGRMIILEFSIPESFFIKQIFLFYLRYLLPAIGTLISKNRHAYRYLSKTIEVFPYGDDFKKIMEDSGFKNVNFYPQTFGVCTIYVGEK